ncbi:dolichol-phosphate mannosyltransferase subunit 3 [Eurytemora carolleeae]|uniref:dolichol-phosphate mannosyltransferase subunit 3 n=1 Tax=Eurytemora carolleeae TaxID=1294199 RepID=UPI000C77E455|nr:dolichol-phosphate mannosyltransferase subunit 3 [Eurytemora carolleeae]|eukprot:XP_023327316.1 dolichol-phosphate mannosyltransferase subunit 3-like [Eurytemora affinis]
MTKLLEWVSGVVVFLSVWVALLTGQFGDIEDRKQLVLFSPLIAVAMFGIYSIIVIAYRVATFNDCEEAAAELQKQITEAREDLRDKGFKFQE